MVSHKPLRRLLLSQQAHSLVITRHPPSIINPKEHYLHDQSFAGKGNAGKANIAKLGPKIYRKRNNSCLELPEKEFLNLRVAMILRIYTLVTITFWSKYAGSVVLLYLLFEGRA